MCNDKEKQNKECLKCTIETVANSLSASSASWLSHKGQPSRERIVILNKSTHTFYCANLMSHVFLNNLHSFSDVWCKQKETLFGSGGFCYYAHETQISYWFMFYFQFVTKRLFPSIVLYQYCWRKRAFGFTHVNFFKFYREKKGLLIVMNYTIHVLLLLRN